MAYSEELIKEVKELYPDSKEMHELAENGDAFLGRYLNDSCDSGIGLNEILLATSLDELQEKARLMMRKVELYKKWCKEDPRKKSINMKENEGCKFQNAWMGQCGKPIHENGMCEEHSKLKCVSCGAQATHACSATGQFVCGAPLCDDCEHTTAMDGSKANIGFFKTSPPPEGMKEHCKKSEQKVFPWYVTSMKKQYPYFVEVLDKFDNGELTYLEADKLLEEFIAKKNKEKKKMQTE
jgi:hypothetical protein